MSNIKFGLQLELKGDQVVVRGLNGTRTAVADLEKEVDKHSTTTRTATESNRGFSTSFSSLSTQAKAFGGVLAAIGVTQFVRNLYATNAETQKLQASLVTVTGSQRAAADAWEELEKFASTTPYQLEQSINAFVKMQALGLDPTIPKLQSLGNTASAMGKDLMQMIEAVADASTGEFERLKEFGIKASSEGNKVRLTFQGVTKEISKNASEITDYLLNIGNTEFAGAMERQMDTLGGAMSNLSDNVDSLMRAIGESGGNDGLAGAISYVSGLVQSLTGFIDDLGGPTIASVAAEIERLELVISTGSSHGNRGVSKTALQEKLAGLREELVQLKAIDGDVKSIEQVIASLNEQIAVLEGSSAKGRNRSATNSRIAELNIHLAKFKAMLDAANSSSEESEEVEGGVADAVSKTTQALLDKIAVIKTENQLLALGYDIEDAKFIAAYAHADALTQAYMRQQREQKAIIDLYAEEAAALQALSESNDADLQDQIDKRKALADSVQDFLDTSFESDAFEAFDQLGASLYGVADALDELANRQEAFNKLKAEEGLTSEEVAKINARQAQNQISAYGDITGAAKGYFDEGSKGYKALEAAEKAFRVVEIGMATANLAQKLGIIGTETSAVVASSAIKATAEGSANVASSGVGLPFPANMAAMAATAAILASFGVLLSGNSGGGSARVPTSNYDGSQGITGSRTVLGDVDAVSESIANSLEIIEQQGDEQLGYNAQMALSLQNIERSMLGYTAVLAAYPDYSKGFGLAQEKPLLSQGAPSIADVLAGIETDYLNALLSEPGTDSAKDVFRATLPLAAEFERSIADIVNVATDALAGLGANAAEIQTQISSLVLSPFDVNPQDTADEQNEYIAGYFGSVADSIIAIINPAILNLQLAGEGALETLVRVVNQMNILKDASDSLGSALGIEADIQLFADQLANLAGGVEDFGESVSAFLDFALTDGEQLNRVRRQLDALFSTLNAALPDSRDAVVDFVSGLDLTTDAGQRAFVALTGAADVLDDYYEQLDDIRNAAYDFDTEIGLNDGLQGLRDALTDVGLNLDIVETAASNGLDGLQSVFASLTDAQKAVLEPFSDQILDMVDSVDALADAAARLRDFASGASGELQTSEQRLASVQAEYQQLINAVANGDISRVNDVTAIGQQVITLASQTAESELEYKRIVGAVMASASTVADIIDPQSAIDIATEQLNVLEDIRTQLSGGAVVLPAVESASSPSAVTLQSDPELLTTMRRLDEKLAQLLQENRTGHGAIASNTGKVAKLLDRWDDGDALVVREASA